MSHLTLALVMQASLLASDTPTDSYAEAQRNAVKTGRPVVVLVGAEWCPACVTMKKDVIPEVREEGVLDKVNFAIVDLDEEASLGRQLTGGGKIPQLLMFRKSGDNWRLRRLVGARSKSTVKRFIDEGMALDKKEKKTARVPVRPVSALRP